MVCLIGLLQDFLQSHDFVVYLDVAQFENGLTVAISGFGLKMVYLVTRVEDTLSQKRVRVDNSSRKIPLWQIQCVDELHALPVLRDNHKVVCTAWLE
jgi:hypothetical protein